MILGEESMAQTISIGKQDFLYLRENNYFYIDKTDFIRQWWESADDITLITRPRRFGKTLNMSMLNYFFSNHYSEKSEIFEKLSIWNSVKYRKLQGAYPVIFISFADVKQGNYKDAVQKVKKIIADVYRQYRYLMDYPDFTVADRRKLSDMTDRIDDVTAQDSLKDLSYFLSEYYKKKVIILLDEYDTPIQQGYTEGYYEQITGFMRNLLSGAFKDNSNLSYGFLTGILRVAKESIFSGLNNLKVNSILEDRYSEYFGFTKDEIRGIMEYYGRTDKYEEICKWYDGYRFGDTDIFNPWSVLNYMDENCSAKAYWQSTGDNSIIRQIVAEADDETADNLRKLMQGHMVSSYVDTSVIYPEIRNNPTTIYSFLLSAGYLKVVKKDELHDGNAICDIAIPNKEIFYVYEKEILSALTNVISQSTAIAIQQAIIRQDVPKLQDNLQKLLLNSISSFDYAHENFYHGLILGICAIMNNLYRVDSNRESGHGRYDIQLRPYDKKMPGIIIELKVLKDGIAEACIDTELEVSAKEALAQIERRQYVTAMKQEGITHFFKIGGSFYKKRVKLLSDTE